MIKITKSIALSALLALSMSVAFAHTEVDSTTPENGAVIEIVPSHVIMTFGDQIRVTRVEMTHDSEDSVDLDLDDHKEFSKRFEIPISDMGKGIYQFEWRGLADDGHPMRGSFEFKVE